ncbi:MAG: hypothetical protein HZC01_03135 [Candidatus Kerfeldbacteria bacterium]|nr:hypothetical protein [Candidatus Kerfeldbacteria bacterium]
MAQSMSSSAVTITDDQILQLTKRIITQLRKSGLPSVESQGVIEAQGRDLVRQFVHNFSTHVHIKVNASLPTDLRREVFDLSDVFGNDVTIDGRPINNCFGGAPGARIFFGKKNEYGPPMDEQEYLSLLRKKPVRARLNFKDFLMLYEEEGQKTLRWMNEKRGKTSISFDDVIMCDSKGTHYNLSLDMEEDDSWDWSTLDSDWGESA